MVITMSLLSTGEVVLFLCTGICHNFLYFIINGSNYLFFPYLFSHQLRSQATANTRVVGLEIAYMVNTMIVCTPYAIRHLKF